MTTCQSLKTFHLARCTRVIPACMRGQPGGWRPKVHWCVDSNNLVSFTVIRLSSSSLNHYHALGIKNTASKREIRAAYISLSKKHHPDTSTDVSSHDQFHKIKEAYDVLSNKKKRYEYDYNLARRQHPEMPSVEHFTSKYYTDGTFWMGPKDHDKVKRRFTNGQVVVLLVAFGFFGGLAQLWVVRKLRDMSQEGTDEMHKRSLDHLVQVTTKRAVGQTTAQKQLSAYREQLLASDKTKSKNAEETGGVDEATCIVDSAPSS